MNDADDDETAAALLPSLPSTERATQSLKLTASVNRLGGGGGDGGGGGAEVTGKMAEEAP